MSSWTAGKGEWWVERKTSGGRHGRARIGQELEGEARLAAFIGHSQVANARFAFVASAPALTVGCCPTGILWRVGTVGPVDPAIIP